MKHQRRVGGREGLTRDQREAFDSLFGGFRMYKMRNTDLALDLSLALRSATVTQLNTLRGTFPHTERLVIDRLLAAAEGGYVDEHAVTKTARYIMRVLHRKRKCGLEVARVIIDEVYAMEAFFSRVTCLADEVKSGVREGGKVVVPLRDYLSEEEVKKMMEAAASEK